MKITNLPIIDIVDICNALGAYITDFEFCRHADNASYVPFDCSDTAVNELGENIQHMFDNGGGYLYRRLVNDFSLMNLLRATGIKSKVLIYVSW